MNDSVDCCPKETDCKNSVETTGCRKPPEEKDSDWEEPLEKKPGQEDDDEDEWEEWTSVASDEEPPQKKELDFNDDLDFRPPLVRITEWKNKGNDFFREKKYSEAIVVYSRGLDVRTKKEEQEKSQEEEDENEKSQEEGDKNEKSQEMGDEKEQSQLSPEDESINRMRSQLFSNRAACFLAINDWHMTIADANQALKLEPNYVKALIRRGTAHEALNKYEETLKDYKRVIELDPRNYAILKKIPPLEKKRKEEFEKQKEEMITKLKGMGNWVLNKFGMSVDDFEAKQGPDGGWSIGTKNKK